MLRHAIETQALPAGARLVEKALCTELNVSRTALRESLRELESEGLVVNGARGMEVAAISNEEALNVYAVRAALEGLIVEQFVERASEPAVEALEAAARDLAKAYDKGVVEEIVKVKAEFYEVLCSGASNLIALELLTRLNSRITRLRFSSLSRSKRLPSSIAEINDLVAALRRRDVAAAKSIVKLHVENAAKAALGERKVNEDD